jgi:hypothetical protein
LPGKEREKALFAKLKADFLAAGLKSGPSFFGRRPKKGGTPKTF